MEERSPLTNYCRTVAIRYHFVVRNSDKNDFYIEFVPEEVRQLEITTHPDEPDDTIKPEEIEYIDDVDYLRSLDPKEWKSQDHYKVLGIENLRIKATEDIIKTAYRKKVLKHHPDKRKALGEEIKPDDDYFTNITMAYEVLGNLQKRRAYDSVDPEFDNNIPSSSDIKRDFYKVFSYYFNINSRWSEKRNVPKLGDRNSLRDHVERFYSFWYDFKSWREFSYEDEEDKDKCQDRDERRYVDKLNKAERQRKKKEEMLRIRTLVDLAYNNDPRIAKFKQEDKEKKLAVKRAKQTAAQQRKEEEERALREIQIAKEKAEAAEKARIEVKRQEREAIKKLLKKERKLLRDTCKANNYFTDNNTNSFHYITTVESICENLSVEELELINNKIKSNGKAAFLKIVQEYEEGLEKERQAVLESTRQKNNHGDVLVRAAPEWNEENLQLLVKAVNLFPAGTNQRWEVIANFLNQHGQFKKDSTQFSAKLVLAKAKDLQKTDFSKNNLKEQANKKAFDTFKKEKKNVINMENDISLKLEEVSISDVKNNSEINNKTTEKDITTNGTKEPVTRQEKVSKSDQPWTATEQQLLEQALKTFPASTAERWDRIAESIPSRTKKDCMKRYKELVETVKAKKAAQAAIGVK